ncbi:hypothetical protein FHS29_003759 [Saccharothrix tamanrassetensis]|uniref:PHA accumulation regulator DNA-binding N-terminal domain-containing protein n=1 Tax=Saccharothrix tamanrassetensis TaxID=1051531 RepID=A0A841CNQ6_9PSEU|nr:hypothetical protein [Saccharothrix tamanrassetensis]MBB5957166.1 hypothetical protein [Saccharothrix tamanrassetensis]
MTEERSSADGRTWRRVLRRERDGSLFDPDEQRAVTAEELLDDLRAGRRFRAHRRSTGADCTVEVLAEVLGSALSGQLLGQGGCTGPLSLPGLPAPRHLGLRAAPRRPPDHFAKALRTADEPARSGHV